MNYNYGDWIFLSMIVLFIIMLIIDIIDRHKYYKLSEKINRNVELKLLQMKIKLLMDCDDESKLIHVDMVNKLLKDIFEEVELLEGGQVYEKQDHD